MRPFEVSDHVVLKKDLSLYGIVRRTHHLQFHDVLEDELIIAHAEVPHDALSEFLTTGVPPAGCVFVEFAKPAQGSSLVHQDDLILLNRTLCLGDHVKRDGSPLTGVVIDLQEFYILAPNFSDESRLQIGLQPQPVCSAECGGHGDTLTRASSNSPTASLPAHLTHQNPHTLLYNVPAREVQAAQDVVRDDFVISGNWVGLVDEVEYDVVIVLQNGSVVVVNTTFGLYIPVPDYRKPLVALPELDGFKRPDILVATQGWASTIPLSHPRPGDFVIIDRSQLRNGRWICGSYDPKVPAQGIVMDCRAREVSVSWVSNSQSPDEPPESETIPQYDIQIYENIRTFRDTASLRRKAGITVYDFGRTPLTTTANERHGGSTHGPAQDCQFAYPGQELEIGSHVRFRDISAAAAKYQGINRTTHGKLSRVPMHATRGWDIDEFEIVYMQQHATVMWQNGSTTTTNSTLLSGFALFEPEISPTDIVLKREGMRQKPVNQRDRPGDGIRDFNEMTFFERPHDLLPASAGVVQSVDPDERIACVRWYQKPQLELRGPGQVLSENSRFGPIGDHFEDVSLYEIMSFPSLLRQRGDMCVITSSGKPRAGTDKRRNMSHAENGISVNGAAEASEGNTSIPCLWRGARPRINTARSDVTSKSHKEPDWIGQIILINLDGSITVRLGGVQPCQDVLIDADSVLAIIDEREHLEGFAPDEMADLDAWMEDESELSEEAEPISETVEYEGGLRLDNDSGDDNWLSDKDEVLEDATEEVRDEDEDVEMSDDIPQDIPVPPTTSTSLRQLGAMLSTEGPPQFMVLDREPPADQYGLHSGYTAQASLKRIAQEHKILSTSLPGGEIYVRTYESRLDLLRCLIIGPKDTPYENAPFLIDLYLQGYPKDPPKAHFHSWTSGLGRINPNLYEEGKICLSLLGTWSGKHETERWSDKATILQLLVSLQGLVFVKKPFFNEAGFEGYENDGAYTRESEQYSEKAFVMARGFVKHALLRPPGGLEDILAWLYLPHQHSEPNLSLLSRVIKRGTLLLERSDVARSPKDDALMDSAGEKRDATKVFLKPLSKGASVMLGRTIGELQARLEQLLSNDGPAMETRR